MIYAGAMQRQVFTLDSLHAIRHGGGMKRIIGLSLLMLCGLPGCASISRGVAEAVLQHKEKDTRTCQVEGMPFEGIRQSLAAQQSGHSGHTTKLLMVHGVSEHLPGYSTRLREKLADALQLGVMQAEVKEIQLYDDVSQKPGAAVLRIHRYVTVEEERQLLFYELTWSPITEPDKKAIAFDSSEAYSFRRAGLNATLKEFMNGTVPDLLVYMGDRQPVIRSAVAQAVCWMFHGDWEHLPNDVDAPCVVGEEGVDMANTIAEDDFYFITHSLGSRITLDTIQSLATRFAKAPNQREIDRMQAALRQKSMTVFMLANQLPLLQLGRAVPEVVDASEQYCGKNAKKAEARHIGQLNIVALSDPNDILSYPVPEDYAERFIDSRTCPNVVNVNLNITPVRNLFDAVSFADPMTAHRGYHDDARVIGLMTDGLSREHRAAIVRKRCDWVELRP